jgi:hypothetical protein
MLFAILGVALRAVIYDSENTGSVSMRVLRLAAVFAVLAGPAFAQAPNINLIPETKSLTPEEKEQEAERQKAYKESLKKIPDAKTSGDPWGTVRSTEPAKSAAPAKPKTGSTQTKTETR